MLDYAADADAMGKNVGDDLAEGKATLPLIHAMRHADAATAERLRAAVETGDTDALPVVQAAIRASGGIAYSRARADAFATRAMRALDGLPDNACVDALRGLARYAVDRDH